MTLTNFAKKTYTKFSETLKSFKSPSAGTIDIIVIKCPSSSISEEKADDNSAMYLSTPFYVRFGFVGIEGPTKKKVLLHVNDALVENVSMSLNKDGWAYFHDLMPVCKFFFFGMFQKKNYLKKLWGGSIGTNEEYSNKRERLRNWLYGTSPSKTTITATSTSTSVTTTISTSTSASTSTVTSRDEAKEQVSVVVDKSTENIKADKVETENEAKESMSDSEMEFLEDEVFVMLRTPTSHMLEQMKLREGRNRIVFTVIDINASPSILSDDKVLLPTLECEMYVWDNNCQIVITDVDGTITKTDARGQVMHYMGYDWSHEHVISLLDSIARRGYHIVYLSARSMNLCVNTKQFLFEYVSQQQDNVIQQLPLGPLLLAPNSTWASLKRELIQKAPQDFKIPALRHLFDLFQYKRQASELYLPFYAGFGNRISDILSYRAVKIPIIKIFIMDNDGSEQARLNKQIESETLGVDLLDVLFIKNYDIILKEIQNLFPSLVDTQL
ncbi:lipin [Reticulomyxa filosa]|uniref:Lipin n=1 Tax=Reticulomyxa filosa TaxID=46433 RepID=X6N6G2_RETFI|nr:lipin [Reticulomyxa filosa]|eukprot:ETO21523.1 lipin [Reticulomyxa filosa]